MIATPGRSPSLPTPLAARLKRSTALGLVIGSVSGLAFAGPEGGLVVGGQAQIRQSGLVTDVDQGSSNAIIDWQSFDVG
ncbi:MAG: hypothetical protein AAF526_07745, partial [Pseudomonadota bacterium]